ncbi:MAG: hypothetical protein AAF337_04320 [Pseudomonadota bacterium]
MTISIKALGKCAVILLCIGALNACAAALYREEFNASAVFDAYGFYRVLPKHPFDEGGDDPALVAALEAYLQQSDLQRVSAQSPLERQLTFTLNLDIPAGRRRILALAANDVRTWRYDFRREREDPGLVAIEVFERQSANLIYRAEALRAEDPADTIAALLSGFPPSASRLRALRSSF